MMKNLFWIMVVWVLCGCNPTVYKTLPKQYSTKERLDKAKGFAQQFFEKCDKKDYSEIKGNDIDVNFKKEFTSENLEKRCEKFSKKFGKITVGEFNNAITFTRPADFSDWFFFNVKAERTDSLKFVVVSLYRDKDFVKGLSLMDTATPKIRRRVKYGQPK